LDDGRARRSIRSVNRVTLASVGRTASVLGVNTL